MPTNKQRRDAARRHLERQQQRRQKQHAAHRRWTLLATIAGFVVLAVVVTVVVIAFNNDDKKPAAKSSGSGSGSTSPSVPVTHAPLPVRKPAKIASRAAKKTTGPCRYAESASTLKDNPDLFDVGLPPDPASTPKAKRTAVFATNLGDVTVEFDGASAPCNVQSLEYLIGKKFFDNTACPRSVNSGIFVVQCGDPTGSTGGGPTYTVKDENLSQADYSAGTLAMANSGANTNSSQFFFITKDSNQNAAAGTGLEKKYTVVGHVTKGLDIVQKVAQSGDDGSNQAGGGRPNTDLIFKTVRLEAANG
ncbi:MAG TPA: peptidylprolyl isomerase [Jatrophihabitantaceae bacterium]|nr:peptidylprolyl isomerase [Jatrophihabitantaceae bacterium]